jgi:hypothetical protein
MVHSSLNGTSTGLPVAVGTVLKHSSRKACECCRHTSDENRRGSAAGSMGPACLHGSNSQAGHGSMKGSNRCFQCSLEGSSSSCLAASRPAIAEQLSLPEQQVPPIHPPRPAAYP